MSVVSVRLKEDEIRCIEEAAKREGKGKGEVMRELIRYGFDYLMLKEYKEGRISLGKLAKELSLCISETIDLLAEFGITSPIDYEDVLEGYENLKGVF